MQWGRIQCQIAAAAVTGVVLDSGADNRAAPVAQALLAAWHPQLPEAPSPQQDAFSDGSQQDACLAGAQQLAAWPSALSRSSPEADEATGFATTTLST